MLRTAQLLPILLLLAPHSVSAQYYYYGDNGISYGVRIAIGVAIAVGVALVILLAGFIIRRRRARAFKQAYNPSYYQQSQQQGANGTAGAASYPPYSGQGYQPQPSYGQAPPYTNYGPAASGYNPQYAPPAGSPPATTQTNTNTNDNPYPPAENAGSYYAPPPGPPPSSGAKV